MKPASISTFLGRLIWLCVLPPVILAIYFAVHEVRTLQDQDNQQAEDQVRNIARDVDSRLQALILPLQVLATSSSVDDPPRLSEFYNECKAFQKILGVHVILADTSKQMLLNTLAPYGASLPKLPPSKGHAAAPAVLETGKPAVGDLVFGPVANIPLIAVAVPVIRDDRVQFLLLGTIGSSQFQQRLDQISIPEGWVVTVFDGANGVIARRSPPEAQGRSGEDEPGKSFVARSAVSRWSVVLKVPQILYRSQIMEVTAVLAGVILAVTFISVVSGRVAARRLTKSVAGLAEVPIQGVYQQGISEIEVVRKKLEDSAEARDKAVAKLQESEHRYRDLYENAPDMYATVDATGGQIIQCNETLLRVTGYSKDEVIGHPVFRLYHPDGIQAAQEAFRSFRLAGKVDNAELQLRRKDGSKVYVMLNASPVYDDSGNIVFSRSSLRDIDDRKRAEEALRESEQRYRAVVDNIEIGISLLSSNLEIVEVNRVFKEFFPHIRPGCGQICYEQYNDPPRSGPCSYCPSVLTIQDGEVHEAITETPAGSEIRHYHLVSSPIKDSDGQVQYVIEMVEDITDRKRAEETLRLSEERYRSLFEHAPLMYAITRNEQGFPFICDCNEQFLRSLSYTREEVLGKPLADFYSPESRKELLEYGGYSQALAGEFFIGERQLLTKNGRLVPTLLYTTVEMDALGHVTGTRAMFVDITERKEAEQEQEHLRAQLFQAQKMESVGTLAGGIAHDFNNLLQVTLGYSELLLQEKTERDADYGDLQKIFHAARSGAELVRSLLAFSRKAEPKPVPMNLNHEIRHVEKLLHRTIPRMIDIRLDLAEDLERINADPAQIEQIIMNLAVNARDAMGEEGSLKIRTESVTLDDEYCRFNLEAKPGDFVLLSVSDTGHGMDRKTLQRIFEPFYTTKELGRGTGLGLAMVYGIVRQHGGHIDCYSEVGKGTTFKLYFPVIPSIEEPAFEATGIMPAFGTETILLVDDEDLVRELGQRILTRSGYTVLTVARGEEALEVYGREKERIALVILDLIMPTMGGKDCLKKMLKIDPQARILISSGYSADASKKECLGMGAKGFVAKPFRFKELLQQVRMALDEG